MIVLDTNVISEVLRPRPANQVAAWMRGQPPASLFITTLTEAELLYGVAILPDGKRKSDLSRAVRGVIAETFEGRILSFDSRAAEAYAEIARRRSLAKPIAELDAQIAAITRAIGSTLATRNIDDFSECGIDLLNPWEAA